MEQELPFSSLSPPLPQLLQKQFAKKSTSLQDWSLEKITIHQEHRWLIQNLIGIKTLFSPSFTPDIDNVLSLPSSPLDNVLSLSSQVPDKILFSVSAYSDKTLFSYISTPSGKWGNVIFSPFLGEAYILSRQCKAGKGRMTRKQKKGKKSHCVL